MSTIQPKEIQNPDTPHTIPTEKDLEKSEIPVANNGESW
jgi:hypothetical protein